MKSFWLLLLFVYIPCDNAHSLMVKRDESEPCDKYVGYMVNVIKIKSDKLVPNAIGTHDRDIEYTNIAPGVILSDRWIITSGMVEDYMGPAEDENDISLLVQFGVTSAFTEPSDNYYHRGIKSMQYFNKLGLIEVNETFPLKNETVVFVKAAKLPPSMDYASKCRKPLLNGWSKYRKKSTHGIFYGTTIKIPAELKCYNGNRKESINCTEGQKEFIFPYYNVTFCFGGEYVKKLRRRKGNAILCDDDVLIGIIYDTTEEDEARNTVEVGHYMTWIAKTTGIKVAYQSVPRTTTTTTTAQTTNTTGVRFRNGTTEMDDIFNAASRRIPSSMSKFLIITVILSLYRLIAY